MKGASGSDIDGSDAARAEASLQGADIHVDPVRSGIPSSGAGEDELADARLGQVARAGGAHARQRKDAGRIRDLDGRASRTELDSMVGGKGQRATRREGQRTAVDGNDISGTGVAEIRISGELQFAFGNRDRTAERVRGGKGDDSGSGLSDAGGASENSGDRAGTQQEVGGRRKAASGAGDGT